MTSVLDLPPGVAPSPPPLPAAERPWRQVLAVAGMEIRLILRAPAFWTLLVVFTLLMVLTNGLTFDLQSLLNVAIALQVGLFPLLVARTVARDRARRMTLLLQTRPVGPVTYAGGQWLGNLALCLVLQVWALIVPVVVAVFAGRQIFAEVVPLAWGTVLLTLTVAGLFVTSWATGWVRLSPVPLLGALAAMLSATLLIYRNPFVLTRPFDLPLASAFFSPAIGYGPDGGLVAAQWGLSAGAALVILALALVIASWRAPVGVQRRRSWLAIGTIAIAGLVLLCPSLVGFQANVQLRTAALGPALDPPLAATFTDDTLDVTLDPASGAISGTTTLTLQPQAPGSTALVVALNPGLRVTHATVGAVAITPQVRMGWWTLPLANSAAQQGQPTPITIAYQGTLTLPRSDYAHYEAGLSFGPQTAFADVTLPVAAYAGQGVAFLQAGGDWYPRPWVTNEAGSMNQGDVLQSVRVALPLEARVIHSAGSLTRQGTQQVVQVQATQRLPGAFLAAVNDAQSVTVAEGVVLAHGATPQGVSLTFAATLLHVVRQLQGWLGSGQSAWQAVFLPLITTPQVGPGVIFVPEITTSDYADLELQPDLAIARLYADAYYLRGTLTPSGRWHAAAQLMALAWWQAQLDADVGAGTVVTTPTDTSGMGPPQRALFPPHADLVGDIVAAYLADLITGDQFGSATRAADLQLRRQMHVATQQRVHPDDQQQELALSALFQTAYLHGLEPLGSLDGSQMNLALVDLETSLGRDPVLHLLRDYLATHVEAPSSLKAFGAYVTQQSGLDFTAMLATYQPPPPLGATTGTP